MVSYKYVKKAYKDKKPRRWRVEVWLRRLSLVVVVLGLVVLGVSVGPIAFYEIFTTSRFREADLLTPVSLGASSRRGGRVEELDLRKIEQWYPGVSSKRERPVRVGSYILAVPKLGIERATVRIGGEDLAKSLVHFGETALPGERGNGVIIGHSALPQFFDQRNYLMVFSLLPRLEVGDKFLIYYDGAEYRYRVEDMAEVGPSDLSVLEQRMDDSYITLITCVPPGLTTRRLAVRGRLERDGGL